MKLITLNPNNKEKFFGMILKTPIWGNYIFINHDGHIGYKIANNKRDSFSCKTGIDIHDHWWNHDHPLPIVAEGIMTVEEADKAANDYDESVVLL